MSNARLSFREFRASLVVYPYDKTPPHLADNGQDAWESTLSYADETSFIFCGGLIYRLHIGNEEWISHDLLELEKILYREWYLNEVAE